MGNPAISNTPSTMSSREAERNQDATVYLGNLDERCTDALVWELMLQAGPISNLHLPKDRVSMAHQGFGFCEFLTENDAEYACRIMNGIKLFGKPIRVNKASSDRKQIDIGANLFVGNLDINVDETTLYNAFSNFGTLVQPAKIQRDEAGNSKGFGFVSFDSFEAADQAIESLNGQFLMNKAINVQYAFKKDTPGERHGTEAERLLAAQARKNGALAMMAAPPPPNFLTGANAGAMPPPPGFGQPAQPGPPPGFGQQRPMGFAPPGYPQQGPPGYPPQGMPYQQPRPQNGFVPPPPVGFQ